MTTPDDEQTIRALDLEQEREAERLHLGYRVIRGVAGSGKTLILTHRAKYLAELYPQWRILLLCFNRPLAVALKEDVKGTKNVTVETVGQLAARILRQTGTPKPAENDDSFYDLQIAKAVQAIEKLSHADLYRVVLVDEAQDMGPTELDLPCRLDLAWAMLKDCRDHFVMALDSAQNVYRREMRWNPPGTDVRGRPISARGRTKVFKINYRNTRPILDLAQAVLPSSDPTNEGGTDPDQFDDYVIPEAAVRTGPLPPTFACADLATEVSTIASEVARLRAEGVEPEHIVVLSGRKELRRQLLRQIPDGLDAKGDPTGAVLARGKVRVATLYWAKGLEFPHVIIGGANHTEVYGDDEETRNAKIRRLLYVAMTRATKTLTVTYSGTGVMDIIRSQQLRIIDPKDFGSASRSDA